MQQLDNVILEDDLARGQGNVFTYFEEVHIGLLDIELAVAALKILQQIAKAGHQVLTIGRHGLAQDFRIGQDEVRRRDRVDILLGIKLDLATLGFAAQLGLIHGLVQPVGGQEVALFNVVKDDVLVPFGIPEALVARRCLDHRLDLLAHHPPRSGLPEVHMACHRLACASANFCGSLIMAVNREVKASWILWVSTKPLSAMAPWIAPCRSPASLWLRCSFS